jgi:pimeloyl-ACP methyl ester carboxylesterase
MSALHLEQRLVHYEALGRGQPIIFLHSWLGSWRYWIPTMELAAERYRTYALDFWGFGESDRAADDGTISGYVRMLYAFMDAMGISTANLVGHGLGGAVAIQAAYGQPERFLKVMTVATPLYGHVLTTHLQPRRFARLLGLRSPTNVWPRLIRTIPIANPDVQQELYTDTATLSEQLLATLQTSLLATDLRPALLGLRLPLLAVYGSADRIVAARHATLLNQLQETPVQLLVLPKVNHFPFLEQTNLFTRLLLDFLQAPGLPVTIKAEWRRRVSQAEYL